MGGGEAGCNLCEHQEEESCIIHDAKELERRMVGERGH